MGTDYEEPGSCPVPNGDCVYRHDLLRLSPFHTVLLLEAYRMIDKMLCMNWR